MSEQDEPGWSRSEWARWWLDHDEPDEAACALELGDEVVLPRNDARDLAAALARRGLAATYDNGVLFVTAAAASDATASVTSELGTVGERGPRRPPQRASSGNLPQVGAQDSQPAAKQATKKTA